MKIEIRDGQFNPAEDVIFTVHAPPFSTVILIARESTNDKHHKVKETFTKKQFEVPPYKNLNSLLDGTNLFMLSNEEKSNVSICRRGLDKTKSFESLLEENLRAADQDFPHENFIFETFVMPRSGQTDFDMKAPDRFVTFSMQAISIDKTGVGFSKAEKIEIFKPLIVSIEDPLPTQMFHDEILTVNVRVVNMVDSEVKTQNVKVQFTSLNDFDVIAADTKHPRDIFCEFSMSNPSIEIPYQFTSRVTFHLKPKFVGTGIKKVSFVAKSQFGEDSTTRKVEVMPSNIPHETIYEREMKGGLDSNYFAFESSTSPMIELFNENPPSSKNTTLQLIFSAPAEKTVKVKNGYQVQGFTLRKNDGVDLLMKGVGKFKLRIYPKFLADGTEQKKMKLESIVQAIQNPREATVTKFKLELKPKVAIQDNTILKVTIPGNFEFNTAPSVLERHLQRVFEVRNAIFSTEIFL